MIQAIVEKGIVLHPFSADNADLVLSWRNTAQVRENSLDNTEIAHTDHLAFVENLENDPTRNFFVFYLDREAQAVLNVNLLEEGVATWGCYLGETKIRPGVFPMLVLLSAHFAFSKLNARVLKSDVLAQNSPPLKLNKFLGITNTSTRTEFRHDGSSIDVVEFELQRSEFKMLMDRASKVLTQHQRGLISEYCAAQQSRF